MSQNLSHLNGILSSPQSADRCGRLLVVRREGGTGRGVPRVFFSFLQFLSPACLCARILTNSCPRLANLSDLPLHFDLA